MINVVLLNEKWFGTSGWFMVLSALTFHYTPLPLRTIQAVSWKVLLEYSCSHPKLSQDYSCFSAKSTFSLVWKVLIPCYYILPYFQLCTESPFPIFPFHTMYPTCPYLSPPIQCTVCLSIAKYLPSSPSVPFIAIYTLSKHCLTLQPKCTYTTSSNMTRHYL